MEKPPYERNGWFGGDKAVDSCEQSGTATVDIPFSVKTFKFAANSLSKFAGHFIESLSMELKLSPAVETMVLPATGCLLFRGGTATTEDVVAEQSYAYLFPLCN
nr:hypothetical protein Iba_chr03eCG6110 [Ipomoea batatas]